MIYEGTYYLREKEEGRRGIKMIRNKYKIIPLIVLFLLLFCGCAGKNTNNNGKC
ncbi:hypothetical protein [Eisenbergiella tayi]|uniref:hypothetical protein n=1 Tax=Eisenbergiella tayi TaxID=1432052 RepID=UPI0014957F09|nr:hypothetical protein [Eisenbergiella tayi]